VAVVLFFLSSFFSPSLSVSLREKFLPCSGFLNQENGVISILIRYIYMFVCDWCNEDKLYFANEDAIF
jgi:hypothetical protein